MDRFFDRLLQNEIYICIYILKNSILQKCTLDTNYFRFNLLYELLYSRKMIIENCYLVSFPIVIFNFFLFKKFIRYLKYFDFQVSIITQIVRPTYPLFNLTIIFTVLRFKRKYDGRDSGGIFEKFEAQCFTTDIPRRIGMAWRSCGSYQSQRSVHATFPQSLS